MEVEEKLETGVMLVVEEMPAFNGGEEAMRTFIQSHIVIPEKARSAGVTGTIYVQFTVEANGDITNIRVIRGLGYGLDEEAVRLLKLMKGMWRPGKQGGKPVGTQMVLPVSF